MLKTKMDSCVDCDNPKCPSKKTEDYHEFMKRRLAELKLVESCLIEGGDIAIAENDWINYSRLKNGDK